jgi:hypothetical protein
VAALEAPRLAEQRVVTVAVAMGAVGLAVAYLPLFALTLALGLTLFSSALVEGAAASLGEPPAAQHYLSMAAFGLVIGALGSSLAEESYFRHVAFADEET